MSHILLFFFVLLFNPFYVTCEYPGPLYPPTKGEVWPKPQYQEKSTTYYSLGKSSLYITKLYHTCDILEEGIKRHLHRNFARKQSLIRAKEKQDERKEQNDGQYSNATFFVPQIDFGIELTAPCENYPHLDMDEKYLLVVRDKITLSSASIWGILRGMETFEQLIYFSNDYTDMLINDTVIEDYPDYQYRGLLIDTGRHYLNLKTIRLLIDAMEMNKMNVLHWHMVDDQSFPYQSEIFPELSKKGAYHPSMVYTKEDIQLIIERGRLAGIRVVPEFDVPGHVRSWGEGYPNILTKCYNNKKFSGLGPLDPTNNETYTFLSQLYKEVIELFPDEYIHLGGDEVNTMCWKSNPYIQDFLNKHHIYNINELQSLFMSDVITLLPAKAKYMIWQDVLDSGVTLPNNTILQVWKYEWVREMITILKAGYRVVYSSSWYLDYLDKTWEDFYRADPRHMVFLRTLKTNGLQNIIGGEACMWGEKVDDANIFPRIWPRASATAERLWSGMNYTEFLPSDLVTKLVRRRLEEHACRMRQRGIPAEPPNGPGFCFITDSKSKSKNNLHRKLKRKFHEVEASKEAKQVF